MSNSDNVYNQLKRQIDGIKKDLAINYTVIDELTPEQRREIETKIVRLCEVGYTETLRAIPYLKTVDVESELPIESIKPENTRARGLLLMGMYIRSNNDKYFKELYLLAQNDPMVFNDLIDLYNSSLVDEAKKAILRPYIDEIARNNMDNPNYKYLYMYKMNNGEELSTGALNK